VLVLDSSRAEVRAQNRSMASRLDFPVEYHAFDGAMPPFEKFKHGADLVNTPYAAMCADDDLVLPESLPEIVAFLDGHPEHSVAHGWYFSFDYGASFDLPGVVYRGASLDADEPLARLHECLRRYEALTYGVFRTDVLARALGAASKVSSMMAKELVGGVVAAIAGKVARLPGFYYGRSLGPSQSYANWVPVHFLARSTAELFQAYREYRPLVLDALQASGCTQTAAAGTVDLVDLIHLRYLADYAKPAVLDDLIAGRMSGGDPAVVAKNALPLLVDANSRLEGFARRSLWVRKLRNRLAPNLRLTQLQRALPHHTVQSTTADGQPRRYRFMRSFMSAVRSRPDAASTMQELVRGLDKYA
jgi:glycosyltransferase domain-containing protein